MSDDHFTPPSANISSELTVVYAGFWRRAGAVLIDTIIAMIIMVPLIYVFYGEFFAADDLSSLDAKGLFIENIIPIVLTVFFWTVFKATPGKMAVGCEIVNAKTGEKLGIGRSIVRYLGYFISTLPLGLGFLWVVFNKRKRGWHDLIAGTVVIRKQD